MTRRWPLLSLCHGSPTTISSLYLCLFHPSRPLSLLTPLYQDLFFCLLHPSRPLFLLTPLYQESWFKTSFSAYSTLLFYYNFNNAQLLTWIQERRQKWYSQIVMQPSIVSTPTPHHPHSLFAPPTRQDLYLAHLAYFTQIWLKSFLHNL